MDKCSIIIGGVGGQGTLLASRIIGNAAIAMGYDVKVSEVHGMSQRGGSVVTYVKYSIDKVNSPLISEGEADFVLAFELLEAYRMTAFVKKGGCLVANTQKINPMPVIIGAAKYPTEIAEKISGLGINLVKVDAFDLARSAGNQKAVNTVLIGILAAMTDIPKEVWLSSLSASVPEKLLDVNIKAFEVGFNYISEGK